MQKKFPILILLAFALLFFAACRTWIVDTTPGAVEVRHVDCGSSITLWEAHSVGRQEGCDVTVRTGLGSSPNCESSLRVTKYRGATLVTNTPGPGQPLALSDVYKIELICASSFENTNGCLCAVDAISRASSQDTVITNIHPQTGSLILNPLRCGDHRVIYPTSSFTNVPANVTIDWRGATNCNAKIVAVFDSGRTNVYPHGNGTNWKLGTFIDVARLEVFCEGTNSAANDFCAFNIVQIERKK